jgi:hypothetical protein
LPKGETGGGGTCFKMLPNPVEIIEKGFAQAVHQKDNQGHNAGGNQYHHRTFLQLSGSWPRDVFHEFMVTFL